MTARRWWGWERLNRVEASLIAGTPDLPAHPAHPVLIVVTAAGRAGGLWLFLCAVEAVRPDRNPARVPRGVALEVSQLVKRLVPNRPDSSSFPSAHAATAAAFTAVTAAYHRRLTALVALLTIMATYGRLRTRVHWPTDVLAGIVVGVGSAFVTTPRLRGVIQLGLKVGAVGHSQPVMRAVRMGSAGMLIAVMLAGCADDTGERDASSVASRFLGATGRGDTQAACALLTPEVREDLLASDGQACEESLPADRLRGTVTEAAVWSGWAQVNTDGGSIFLTEFDSGWLVAAAGCEPNGDGPYRCVVGG